MNLVPIGVRNLKDVPGNLRKLADDLENGKYAGALTAICVLSFEDGYLGIYGYGERTSPLETLAWLAMAQAKIAAPNMSRNAEPDDVG